MTRAVVIGAGPAGLMAAEVMAAAGLKVCVVDQKPSFGRKFLMAGKSGLNLTKDEPPGAFQAAYCEASGWLAPILDRFGPKEVQDWARDLGQDVFTGSTGRVFPNAMKASPLLRAWLARLDHLQVERRTRWRWAGWQGDALIFETPDGVVNEHADVTVLAAGGASWTRLGSDGAWAKILADAGISLAPFQPANVGLHIEWSEHMRRHFGAPLKNLRLMADKTDQRGEAVISAKGLEGSGIYAVSKAVREGAVLFLDLLPDLSAAAVQDRLSKPRGKASLSTHLRKVLKLDPPKIAILQEFARPLPEDATKLAALIKALKVPHLGLRPMEEAISTAGGIPKAAVDDGLMLTARPGVFAAGEMLDWEAPTGGYLLTGCLATGRWAGRAAVRYAATGRRS